MEKRAVVVGAGIAGLAMAHALSDLGYRVRVFERSSELPAEGAGLTLWPNAVRALDALGLGDVVAECTHVVTEAVTLSPDGGVLARVPLERIGICFGPLVSAHRADLLLGLSARFDGAIEFDAEVEVLNGRPRVGNRSLDCDLLVGADGIGSAVRAAVAPGISPRAAGYAAWRGVAKTGESTVARASETIGRGQRFGLVPLSQGRTYWFAVLAGGDRGDDLDSAFATWHAPIAQVLAATPQSDRSYLPLGDLPPLPRWSRDHLVLVGDAAHAMTPNLGQGAGQALEDIVVLSRHLAAARASEALRAYENQRKRRAERIVKQSRALGRILQTSNSLAAELRDALFRQTPEALLIHRFKRLLDPSASGL